MRLILLNQLLDLRKASAPADTIGFHCFEDFSVGPLPHGVSQDAFDAARAAFWKGLPGFRHPDHPPEPFGMWHQVLPMCDLTQMADTPSDDWPAYHLFEDVAPKADRIEIWASDAPRDQLWLWYLAARLPYLGVAPKALCRCAIPDHRLNAAEPDVWAAMVADQADRQFKAQQLTPHELPRLSDLWTSAVAGQRPKTLTPAEAHVFDILEGRRPDPTTGLTNLEARLLAAAPTDWTKMARVVADAMGAGWHAGDNVGDMVLQSVLMDMARRTPPLVEITGTGSMRYCQVRRISNSVR